MLQCLKYGIINIETRKTISSSQTNLYDRFSAEYKKVNNVEKYTLTVGTTGNYKIAYKKANSTQWYTKSGRTIFIEDLSSGDVVYTAIVDDNNNVYSEYKITITSPDSNVFKKEIVKTFDTITNLMQE